MLLYSLLGTQNGVISHTVFIWFHISFNMRKNVFPDSCLCFCNRVCLTNKRVVSPVLPGIWVVKCKWTVMKVWLFKSNLFWSQSLIMLLLLQSCGPLRLVRMSMKVATFTPEAFSPASKRICRSSKKHKHETRSLLQSLISLFNILDFLCTYETEHFALLCGSCTLKEEERLIFPVPLHPFGPDQCPLHYSHLC